MARRELSAQSARFLRAGAVVIVYIYTPTNSTEGYRPVNSGTHGGGDVHTPPSLFLCLFLKISLGNTYLKILDLANLFVADVPKKRKIPILVPLPLRASEISVQKAPMGEENRKSFPRVSELI